MLITRGLGTGSVTGDVPTEKVYVPLYDPTIDVVSVGNNTIFSSVLKPSILVDAPKSVPNMTSKSESTKTLIDALNLKPTILVKKD